MRNVFLTMLYVTVWGISLAYGMNTVQCSSVNFQDLQSNASQRVIGQCFIDSDDAAGFTVEIQFENKGEFSNSTTSISLTQIHLDSPDSNPGSLGSGLSEPDMEVMALDGSGNYEWTPTGTRAGDSSGNTVGYLIRILGSWNGSSNLLAGFYTEKLHITIR